MRETRGHLISNKLQPKWLSIARSLPGAATTASTSDMLIFRVTSRRERERERESMTDAREGRGRGEEVTIRLASGDVWTDSDGLAIE